MRLLGALGVLCLVATPVLGGASTYTFDVTAGSVAIQIQGDGSTGGGLAGTFAVTIYSDDGHIGESDMVILEDSFLYNTDYMKLGIGGIATANVGVVSARFTDFLPEGPEHITPSGTTGVGIVGDIDAPEPGADVDTDVIVEVTAIVTGLFQTTFQTEVSAGFLLPFGMTISTSVGASDIATATLNFTYGWVIPIPDISLTLTLDLVVGVEGTTHVPEPIFGGLTALGLGGAGFWMRNRRK